MMMVIEVSNNGIKQGGMMEGGEGRRGGGRSPRSLLSHSLCGAFNKIIGGSLAGPLARQKRPQKSKQAGREGYQRLARPDDGS